MMIAFSLGARLYAHIKRWTSFSLNSSMHFCCASNLWMCAIHNAFSTDSFFSLYIWIWILSTVYTVNVLCKCAATSCAYYHVLYQHIRLHTTHTHTQTDTDPQTQSTKCLRKKIFEWKRKVNAATNYGVTFQALPSTINEYCIDRNGRCLFLEIANVYMKMRREQISVIIIISTVSNNNNNNNHYIDVFKR